MSITPHAPEIERLDFPLGDELPDNLASEAVDPAVLVKELQASIPDPFKVDPHSAQHLVDALLELIQAFLEREKLPLDVDGMVVWSVAQGVNLSQSQRDVILQIVRDLWRARDVLVQFHDKLSVAMVQADDWMRVDESGSSRLYREVVGPLIDGQCFGPPACTESALAAYGTKPMPIAPVASWPFTTMRAYGVYKDSVGSWWSNVVKSVAESVQDFSKATSEALQTIGEGIEKAGKSATSGLVKIGKAALWVGGGLAVLWLGFKVYRATRRNNPEGSAQ